MLNSTKTTITRNRRNSKFVARKTREALVSNYRKNRLSDVGYRKNYTTRVGYQNFLAIKNKYDTSLWIKYVEKDLYMCVIQTTCCKNAHAWGPTGSVALRNMIRNFNEKYAA